MSVTKGTGTSLLSAVTTTTTSSVIDVSADYSGSVYVHIVIVGTPTVAPTFQVQESPDAGATYYSPPTKLLVADLVAGDYYAIIPIELETTKIKVTFTQQTGGTSSTCTAQYNNVTGI